MKLVRREIPRSWLPGRECDGKIAEALTGANMYELWEILGELPETATTHIIEAVLKKTVGVATSTYEASVIGEVANDTSRTVTTFEQGRYLGDQISDDWLICTGVYALLALWHYSPAAAEGYTDVYFVALWWDKKAQEWRPAEEQWLLEHGSQRLTTIYAAQWEMESDADGEGQSTIPHLTDVVALACGGEEH